MVNLVRGRNRRSRSGSGYVGNRGAVTQALREQSAISTATGALLMWPVRLPANDGCSTGRCCRIYLVDVDAQRPRQGL
jgi:hypothetical protein